MDVVSVPSTRESPGSRCVRGGGGRGTRRDPTWGGGGVGGHPPESTGSDPRDYGEGVSETRVSERWGEGG